MKTSDRILKFTLKQKKITGTIVIILFLLFCSAIGYFIGRPMIEFVSEPEKFRVWVNSHGVWAKLAFIAMMAFQVILALIPGEPLEIGAGYAFGAIWGTILTVTGIALGSIIVFFLVRKFGIKFIEVFFSYEKIKQLKFLQKSKKRDLIIFLLLFLPGSPKDLITYFIGITDINIKNFVILASFARMPSVITSTLGGSALGTEKYKTAIIVFSITAIVSIIGLYAYKLILNRREKAKK